MSDRQAHDRKGRTTIRRTRRNVVDAIDSVENARDALAGEIIAAPSQLLRDALNAVQAAHRALSDADLALYRYANEKGSKP